MPQNISLLCIDDEPLFLDAFRARLEQEPDLTVITAASGTEALDLLNQQYFDAIIADYAMPDMDGLALLREIRARGGQSIFVMATAKRLAHIAQEATSTGADYYLQKGADMANEVSRLVDFLRTRVPQKNAEYEMTTWARFYNSIIDNGDLLICRIKPDGTITFANDPCVHFFKKPYRQMVQENFFSYIPENEHGEIRSCLAALSPEHPDCLLLHHVMTGSGEPAALEWGYHAFFSALGEVEEYQLAGRDTGTLVKIGHGGTGRQAKTPAPATVPVAAPPAAPKDEDDEWTDLVTALQSLEVPVFAVDGTGTIIAWSARLAELTGALPGDMIGKGGQEYGVPFYGKKAPMLVDNVLPSAPGGQKTGRPVAKQTDGMLIGEIEHVTLRGRPVLMWGKCSPIYNKAGKLLAVVEVIVTGEVREERTGTENYLGGIASPTLKVAGDGTGRTLAGAIGSLGGGFGIYATTRRVFVLHIPELDANASKNLQFGTFLMDELFGTAVDTRERSLGELENGCMFAAAKGEIGEILLKKPVLLSGYVLITKNDGSSFRLYIDHKKAFSLIENLMKMFAPDFVRYE